MWLRIKYSFSCPAHVGVWLLCWYHDWWLACAHMSSIRRVMRRLTSVAQRQPCVSLCQPCFGIIIQATTLLTTKLYRLQCYTEYTGWSNYRRWRAVQVLVLSVRLSPQSGPWPSSQLISNTLNIRITPVSAFGKLVVSIHDDVHQTPDTPHARLRRHSNIHIVRTVALYKRRLMTTNVGIDGDTPLTKTTNSSPCTPPLHNCKYSASASHSWGAR